MVVGAACLVSMLAEPSAAPPPAPADDALVAAPDAGESAPPPAAESKLPQPEARRPDTPGEPPVSDAAWKAVEGKPVEVTTPSGPVKGELTSSEGDTLVIIGADGSVQSVPKATASGVKVTQPPPSPASEMSSLKTGDPPPPSEEKQTEEPLSKEEERKKKREERRKKREHALLGAFTMQGATYTHVRGDGVKGGHASYAMDWGIGANLSPGFGMYVVGGGLFAAKIRSDPGDGMRERLKHNYGHLAFLFAFGGKYYFSTIGAGVGFNRLRFPDNSLQKDVGLAIPFKLVGKIPLPKKLYIGIGLTYELGMVRGFERFINGIGGQIVFGRW
jgi:hypothetical protein